MTLHTVCRAPRALGLAALLALAAGPAAAQSVRYVDADRPCPGDGASWATAYCGLISALAGATPGTEVWVAAGTYTPHASDRSVSFVFPEGVEVYGGFAGTETARDERDPRAHVTVLSGDLARNDGPAFANNGENSIHVVQMTGVTAATTLDGFTIAGGNSDFYGGGLYCDGAGSVCSPTLRNLVFTGNAGFLGGAVYAGGQGGSGTSSPAFVNTTFSGNAAGQGGAVYADGEFGTSSSPTFVNAVFSGNSATDGGGAVFAIGTASPAFTNATFSGNTAPAGSAVFVGNAMAAPVISFSNSIIWGNTSLSFGPVWRDNATITYAHSLIEGAYQNIGNWDERYGTDGGGNLDADPRFADPDGPDGIPGTADDDLRLYVVSPARDAGANGLLPSGVTTDLDGNPRVADSNNDGTATVDMGAFESTLTCPAGTIFVDHRAEGAADGTSWGDAFPELRDALVLARMCPGVAELWVAEGTYTPHVHTPTSNPWGVPSTDRLGSFVIPEGLEVYGGFVGGEETREERDPVANATVLSGDLAGDDGPAFANNAENSYRVVWMDGRAVPVTAATVLDGFTISGGKADDHPDHSPFSSYGGGLSCYGVDSVCSPTLRNLVFTSNFATNGGAVFAYGFQGTSSPTFVNVTFAGNSAWYLGGAVFIYGWDGTSNPTFVNVTFTGNSIIGTGSQGGAVATGGRGDRVSLTFINTTFSGNTAEQGGAVFADGSSASYPPMVVSFANSILWSNGNNPVYLERGAAAAYTHTLAQGAAPPPGDGNLNADPLFAHPIGLDGTLGTPDDDLRLQPGSPALDAGSNTLVPAWVTADLDGEARIQDGTVDMGAYEGAEPSLCPGAVLFVDAGAVGAETGFTWADAFPELRDALALARACPGVTELWVAEGTYTPSDLGAPDARAASFVLREGLGVYGGFAGGETAREGRDPAANPTVLSGDLAGNDATAGNGENSYHVVRAGGWSVSVTAATVLDGFTVTGGHADGGSFPNNVGAGLYCHGPEGRACSPTLRNVVFTGNAAALSGGAVYADGQIYGTSSPAFVDVTFSGNTAAVEGGAVYANGTGRGTSNPSFVNAVFSGNTAGTRGGAVYANGHESGRYGGTSSPAFTNATFSGNTAPQGGAVYALGSTYGTAQPSFANSILWGNGDVPVGLEAAAAAYTHTLAQGAAPPPGDGNLNADPLFADAGGGDYTLQAASPALDAGSDALLPPDTHDLDGDGDIAEPLPLDLAGNARTIDGDGDGTPTVDLGAYERPAEAVTATVTLDGPSAWRMLSAPVAGLTVDDLAAHSLVQGVPGHYDLPGAVANLYTAYGTTPEGNGWFEPAAGDAALPPGRGFIWYLYEEAFDPFPEEPGSVSAGLPLALAATGAVEGSPVVLPLRTEGDHWTLIGNPYPAPLDVSDVCAWATGSAAACLDAEPPVQVALQWWDPEAEGGDGSSGAGSYVLSTDPEVGGVLPAWQGAFIQSNTATALEVPASALLRPAPPPAARPAAAGAAARVAGAAPAAARGAGGPTARGPTARGDGGAPVRLVGFELRGSAATGGPTLDRAALLYFREGAADGWDAFDATKRPSLASAYALVVFAGERQGTPVPKAQESRPYDPAGPFEVGIHVEAAGTAGPLVLSWPRWRDVPEGWRLTLVDHRTGAEVDLRGATEYAFEVEARPAEGSPLPAARAQVALGPARFALRVTPSAATPSEGGAGLPTAYALEGVYPNPFASSATVAFALPEAAEVRVEVYDVLGRRVAVLAEGRLAAGRHRVGLPGAGLPDGVYLVQLRAPAGAFVRTQKVTLLR